MVTKNAKKLVDEEFISRLHEELGIEKVGPPENWKDMFDPKAAVAVSDLGFQIARVLETFTGIQEQWARDRGSQLEFTEEVRGRAYIGQAALKRAAAKIEEIIDTVYRSGDKVLRHSMTSARRGNVTEVEVLLEGRESSDAIRVIKAIALISNLVDSRCRVDYLDWQDTLSAAAVHLAKLILREFMDEMPGILDKAFATGD